MDAKTGDVVVEAGTRNWAGLHHRRNHPYKNDNPDLPTLQPWVNTTYPPAERFVFKRNPFYHRVDESGHQLPYIDEVAMQITSSSLVAAKAGAGESDLQGRYIRLDNFTFLKGGESRGDYNVRLWQTGAGSKYALYPNLNSNDPACDRERQWPVCREGLHLHLSQSSFSQPAEPHFPAHVILP